MDSGEVSGLTTVGTIAPIELSPILLLLFSLRLPEIDLSLCANLVDELISFFFFFFLSHSKGKIGVEMLAVPMKETALCTCE